MGPSASGSGSGSGNEPQLSRQLFSHPFSKTSPAPQLAPAAQGEGGARHTDLAVARDLSFVETSSLAAANALSKFYAAHGGEDYSVQTRVQAGKTLYRIRPRARPPSPSEREHIPDADPSSARSASPVFARSSVQPPAPAPLRVLRSSKSIPVLAHSIGQALEPQPSLLLQPYPTLRKSDSTPSLSALAHDSFAQRSTRTGTDSHPMNRTKASSADGAPYQLDVFGKLLGWDPPTGSATGREQRKNGPLAFRDRSTAGTARLGVLPGISTAQPAPSHDERDLTDLPEDLDELASIPEAASPELVAPASFAAPPPLERPPVHRTKSHPFGTGVRVPSARTLSSLRPDDAVPPPLLEGERTMREVASSDSIRTAKADDEQQQPPPPAPRRATTSTKRFQDPAVFDFLQSLDLATSAHLSSPPVAHHPYPHQHHARLPSSASVASSLSDLDPHEIVVSAAPGDDPRFVLWGLKDPDQFRPPSIPGTPVSQLGQGSLARRGSIVPDAVDPASPPPSSVGSPATSSSSKRWSLKDRRSHPDASSPASSVRDSISSSEGAHSSRVLMAATVERWVAELTSQISSELLTGFFLTYRTFVRPLDLMRLLTTRFDWAMAPPTSPEDDAARRIVRVRTFVVLRHWLLNHFGDDFVPDRRLRTTLTAWLNAESRLERIRASPKDHRLIKGLKKIVRRLKETHVAIGPADAEEGARLLAQRRAGSSESPVLPFKEPTDEDVDLEIEHARSGVPASLSSTSRLRTRFESAFSKMAHPADEGDFSTLRSPTLSFPLPNSQNAIARSFTSALGTFGRFKRMLGNRGGAVQGGQPASVVGDFGGFELEESATGDLLYAKRGLASFLEYYNIPLVPDLDSNVESPLFVHSAQFNSQDPRAELPQDPVTSTKLPVAESDASADAGPVDPMPPAVGLVGLGLDTSNEEPSVIQLQHSSSNQTIKSVGQFDSPPPSAGPNAYDLLDYHPANAFLYGRPQSGRIELDDVDLSDEDDDVVEVKRTLKRLPGGQNLRLATTLRKLAGPPRPDSVASVMSYGSPHAHAGVSYGGPERESVAYVDDSEDGPGGVQVVANFVLDGIDDSDDDEPGGVEAALRRLEGIVDDSQEREKARRVARQMEKSERLAKTKLAASAGASDAEDEMTDTASLKRMSHTPSSTGSIPASFDAVPPVPESPDLSLLLASPAVPSLPATTSLSSSSKLQPRSITRRTVTAKPAASKLFPSRPPSAVPLGLAPPTHRSFILHCRTEVLAQQFCLIERDMFRLLTWQELVGGGWRDHTAQHADVLDWEAYIKQRRKLDLVAREQGDRTPAALQALIARYNLTSNWVASEIVLTVPPDERVALIAKFIRLAFKCYCQNNFQTMTQIIHGLGLPDIERLKRTWARVPLWEMRKYRGMATFVSPMKNFKHLREVQSALINEYGPAGQRGTTPRPSTMKGAKAPPAPTGCIPFLGIFLKDLASLSELPTFLDPSSTTTPAEVNSVGDLERIADPTAFVSLRALPGGMRLRPLVNVHKFRMIADEIQLVLAFQELSEKYLWEPEPGLYLRTLKIRCLDSNTLKECSIRLTQA